MCSVSLFVEKWYASVHPTVLIERPVLYVTVGPSSSSEPSLPLSAGYTNENVCVLVTKGNTCLSSEWGVVEMRIL